MNVPVIMMHMQGTPENMQKNPQYGDVVEDIKEWLEERINAAEKAGIKRSNIIVDPGIGFGKNLKHNLELLGTGNIKALQKLTNLNEENLKENIKLIRSLDPKPGRKYNCEQDNLYLIPTAEVPLTNLYRNTLLIESELPICLTGYTPCFRREAGSYGSDVRGLNRLHQFDKVEIVRLETQENGKLALDQMIEHVKKILEKLDLPYRILKLCSGDLGFTSSITYDFEVFSAAQKKWLEVSSVSIFNDFQSERLNLKYKTKTGEKKSVYTLNGSSLALPRIVASIIENFQTNDGIIIPRILVPYTGFKLID